MRQVSDIKAIVFDLGGVLIDFTGMRELPALMRQDPGTIDIRARWIASTANSAFERGELSPSDFASAFVEEWDLELEPSQFIDLWRSWIKGPLPGAIDLLEDLQCDCTLACLSNTNELHWDILLGDFGLQSSLQKHYASHLLGKLKPTAEIFDHVCSDLECAPHQVVFFDDGVENVAGAARAGLISYQVNGPAEIRIRLAGLGLI